MNPTQQNFLVVLLMQNILWASEKKTHKRTNYHQALPQNKGGGGKQIM